MKRFYLCFISLLALCLMFSCSNAAGGGGDDKPTSEAPQVATVFYSVRFFSNNDAATGSTVSVSGKKGSSVTLTANSYALVGYKFIGWNTKKDGSGTAYSDGAVVTLTANLDLYAQWQESQGGQSPTPNPDPADVEGWSGAGWYAFVDDELYAKFWYIAKFDGEKKLISANRAGEKAYERVSLSSSDTWPKKFNNPIKTDKTDWDSFKTLNSSWSKIFKFTDSEMETSMVYVLWLFNEKNLDENAIYYAEYGSNKYYFLFNGTDFENSKSPFTYTTYRSNTEPVGEFVYYYNSSYGYEYTPARLLTSEYKNFKKVLDEDLPQEIYRAFRVSSQTETNYRYSYTLQDNTSYTCYARFDSNGFARICVSVDENQTYTQKGEIFYESVVAYKNFSIVSDDDLPLKVRNVFIEPVWSKIYSYTDGNTKYYAKTCSANNEYNAKMATIITCDTASGSFSVPENPASEWFGFATGATEDISVLEYSDVSSDAETLLNGAPNSSDLYTYTDNSGNTVYTKFSGYYANSNYNYCFMYGIIKDKDTSKYSPITKRSCTDWPAANLMSGFKKVEYNEQSSLPVIVKYYTETGLKSSKGINSTVFKFFEKDGTSYYAYYNNGRSYSAYFAKSSDGENFTQTNSSELESLGLPYKFDEIVFLDDFEPTDIERNKIQNAQ
ncbi:MAG: InlB B-repeat-containing protein [Treponema sp.]|nr:InlB B-repeat-containing protein [Treponema sp.]MEE3434321.1 InlB B-repeat-containing protein [Treponema sp.]